jgi:hypothetical protein
MTENINSAKILKNVIFELHFCKNGNIKNNNSRYERNAYISHDQAETGYLDKNKNGSRLPF